MGCCSKRVKFNKYDVMGGYKYLKAHQIRARLEVFKRSFCINCKNRYLCDFKMYKTCNRRYK